MVVGRHHFVAALHPASNPCIHSTGDWIGSRLGPESAGKPDVINDKVRGGGRAAYRETSLTASLM